MSSSSEATPTGRGTDPQPRASPASRAPGARPRCALVLPTYNAADFIGRTVERLRRFVAEHTDWRCLLVCDGCSDDTVPILDRLLADRPERLDFHAYPVNRGKGFALRTGLSLVDTPYRVYTDVDLAYDPDEAVRILELLERGADLAAVNRAHPDSCFLISPRDFPNIYKRHLMSRAFNWWLRRMLPITILDTQAGLKGITGPAWELLAGEMTSDGFFFDVELLARAGFHGLRLAETPVTFRYFDPTTVRMVRHGTRMIRETLRLRGELRRLSQARDAVRTPDLAPIAAASPPGGK
jgi:dolichyl-phosphate beta-glucosyltransferase